MDTFFVKIDRNSIKKNPNAGNETTIIQGPIEFKHRGETITLKQAQELAANGGELRVERYITEFRYFPEDDYFYEYEKIKVRCNNCSGEFFSNELQSDEDWDGENEIYSTEVCPLCGEFDCCVIEYEKIEDALKDIEDKAK